jgi:hypothetical protein
MKSSMSTATPTGIIIHFARFLHSYRDGQKKSNYKQMKKLILVFIFIIGMLSGFNSLFAQSSKVKVSGKIIDQTTQEPLPYVNAKEK